MFIQCPHCSSPVDDDQLRPGERFDCSSCHQPVIAPEDEDESMGRIPETHSGVTGSRSSSSGSTTGRSSSNRRSSRSDSSSDSSSQDEQHWERVTQAYRMIYFIAFFALTLGGISVGLDVSFLQQMGIGVFSALLGAVMGLLGYGVSRGSVTCLVGAILLFAANAVLFLVTGAREIGPRVGGFATQLVLLYPMVRGVSPLYALQTSSTNLDRLIASHTTGGLHHASAGLFSLTLLAFAGLQIAGFGLASDVFNSPFSPDEADVTLQEPPGSPERNTNTINTPAGTINTTNYRWKTSETLYALGVLDLPETAVKNASDQQLLNNIFRGMSARLKRTVRQRNVTQDGYSGIEAEYIANSPHLDETGKGRAAVYIKQSTVIMISYLSEKDEFSTQEAGAFTNSLQLE